MKARILVEQDPEGRLWWKPQVKTSLFSRWGYAGGIPTGYASRPAAEARIAQWREEDRKRKIGTRVIHIIRDI